MNLPRRKFRVPFRAQLSRRSLRPFLTGIPGNLPAVVIDLHGNRWRVHRNPRPLWSPRKGGGIFLSPQSLNQEFLTIPTPTLESGETSAATGAPALSRMD